LPFTVGGKSSTTLYENGANRTLRNRCSPSIGKPISLEPDEHYESCKSAGERGNRFDSSLARRWRDFVDEVCLHNSRSTDGEVSPHYAGCVGTSRFDQLDVISNPIRLVGIIGLASRNNRRGSADSLRSIGLRYQIGRCEDLLR